MVIPGSKTPRDPARRRFWLAMLGFVMALALLPFSYKVERRLETAAHIIIDIIDRPAILADEVAEPPRTQ